LHRGPETGGAAAAQPRDAKRLVRWRARPSLMTQPKFTSPLRPGPPPGNRKGGKEEVDHVLREYHGLAWDALKWNNSNSAPFMPTFSMDSLANGGSSPWQRNH
jgi:hypothetical protein